MYRTILDSEMLSKVNFIEGFLRDDAKKIFNDNLNIINHEFGINVNYFAVGMREVINRTINPKNISKKIKECDWFPEYATHGDDPQKISTKQKLLYLLIGENNKHFFDNFFNIESYINNLSLLLIKLNNYTHFNETVPFITNNPFIEIINVTEEYFSVLANTHNMIDDFLLNLQGRVYDEVVSSSIEQLSEISHSYTDEEVMLYKIIIEEFKMQNSSEGHLEITFYGEIGASLWYGPRNDSANINVLFPLEGNCNVIFSKLDEEIIIDETEIEEIYIDNNSWFE